MSSVAVIIPNYNYADFIEERIDSVLNQTYPISELIILDDASTDNSVRIIKDKIKQIKQDYPKIEVKLIVNEKNSGGLVFSQWQKGLEKIKSDYFWIAEADDSADSHFLQTAMEKLERYPNAVLFHSKARLIDDKGITLDKDSMEWVDLWKSGRWNEDYFNNGEDEIKNYFSANNIILNVSGVIWKNQKILRKIFEEAKEFKVAGDWYIYVRVLESGDITYSAKPLNMYRKHDRGSASDTVGLSNEYREVLKIQDYIKEKYRLTDEQIEWQITRRKAMGMVENGYDQGKLGRIAWFVPGLPKGSGGHNTIIQNANRLVNHGYSCDLYIDEIEHKKPIELYKNVCDWYGEFRGDVYNEFELVKDYDMVVATQWATAAPVFRTKCNKKMYFIQDYEPWFYSMGEYHLEALQSYKYGFKNVSIGQWLPQKLKNEFDIKTAPFSFGADLDVYKRLKGTKKENAVCFIYQPDKPRRCSSWGITALKILQEKRPDVKIYLYGSEKLEVMNENVEHLGILSTKQCNELYNRCKVGLCISSSNPSRIPFEMMAAGLPVVDLYLENNLYDFPEDGCLLAEPDPRAIAAALIKILDDDKLRKSMSDSGEKYMKNYPLNRGFDEFETIVDKIINDKPIDYKAHKKIYNRKAISPIQYDYTNFRGYEFKSVEKDRIEDESVEELKKLTFGRRVYLKIRWIMFGW